MRYLASFVATLAWALWFGGMVALVVFVQTLFAGNRSVAVEAAPMMFVAFGRVQLLLGACALVGSFAWYALTRRRAVMMLFGLFAVSAALAAASLALVVAPMEELRGTGLRESPEFRRLHRWSTSIYMAEMLLLLAAGATLPRAIAPGATPPPATAETDRDTAAA